MSQKPTHKKLNRNKQTKDVRKPGTYRTYSFIVALAIITMVIGYSYYNSLPRIEHIPDNFQFQRQAWMAFVPAETEFFSYVNYQMAFAASSNRSLFGFQPILSFYQLHLDLLPQDVAFSLDVQLPVSINNLSPVTVSIISLTESAMSDFLNNLKETNVPKPQHDGYPLVGLVVIDPVSQKLILAWVSVVEDLLVISTDEKSSKYGVERILDRFSSKSPTLFDNITVQRGVYATGAADAPYVALFIGAFATQFNSTRMIVKSVLQSGNGILVTRSILFPSSDDAMNQYGQAHRVYVSANSYRVLDQWLVVGYSYPYGKLRGELTGL